ncbi:hypothetical protein ACIGBL_08950 [Streptomyces sp. NPDC085614]|uniref:hypothetical protein n=1 Tax=Streptomyces sp. NPDC085614 TaxID=3365733 RepID=UPI0037CEE1C6
MAGATPPSGGQPPADGGNPEEPKPEWEQTMEDLNLGIVPKLYNLFTEGGWVALATAGAVAAGGALVLMVQESAKIAARNITRQALSFVTPRGENGERMTYQRDPASDYGRPQRRPIADVMREERDARIEAAGRTPAGGGAGDGGGAGANHPSPETLETLRSKLAEVNPKLDVFNREIRKVPKARELTKTASAVEKVNTAIAASDAPQITAVAKATGKLASAQRHFDPRKLPKARSLSSAAQAAERLARAGGDVAQAFNTLKLRAREAAAEI